MKYKKKKIIVSFLVLTLVSLVFWTMTGVLANEGYYSFVAGETKAIRSGRLNDGGVIAQQFNAAGEFDQVSIARLSKGTKVELKFYIYQWNGDYDKSVTSISLATGVITAKEQRNAWLDLNFDPLPSGEYVFVMCASRADHYYEIYDSADPAKGRAYLDNVEVEGTFNVRIHFTGGNTPSMNNISDNPEKDRTKPPVEPVLDKDHPINQMGVDPTSWTAVDGLGRELSGYGDTYYINVDGKLEKRTIGIDDGSKAVGIFYHTWNYDAAATLLPRDITVILKDLTEEEYNTVKYDYNNKIWQGHNSWHLWNQPLFGYYSILDEYVLRKHAELLAVAGVDVVIFDCTNGEYTWQPAYSKLMEVFAKARQEGVDTPQVAFMLNFFSCDNTTSMLRKLYLDIYRVGKYQDLWFYWEGKPLILAYNESLFDVDPIESEILDFFTYRKPVATYDPGEMTSEYWGWLSAYPQRLYKDEDGSVEMTTAGIAQNRNYLDGSLGSMNWDNIMGRSYTSGDYYYTYKKGNETITCNSNMENSMYYGLNFQQQMDYAISQDPDFIYITGWNEWQAIRATYTGPDGKTIMSMADCFDDEHSRDIEPSAGVLKDYYYYQLVENIRRFKGVAAPERINSSKTIDIKGDVSQWNDITSFTHYLNNTWDRDADGYRSTHYTNDTMRNDISVAKIAYDDDYIYFYVETAEALSPYTDKGWMRLFIDTLPEGTSDNNWEGYEFIINRNSPTADKCLLERSTGGWNWETVGEVDYTVSGNILQIQVSRESLGLAGSDEVEFNFKWSDNMQVDGDILDFYSNGDTAPTGRMKFSYNSVFVEENLEDSGEFPLVNVLIAILAVLCVTIIGMTVAIVIKIKKKS